MLESVTALKRDDPTHQNDVNGILPKHNAFYSKTNGVKSDTNQQDKLPMFNSRNSFKERAKRKLTLTGARRSQENGFCTHKDPAINDSEGPAPHQALLQSEAFDSARLISQKPPDIGDNHGSTMKDNVKAVVSAVAHPKEAIKTKVTKTAAEKISRAQRPILSLEEDRRFLDVHESLSRQISSDDEPVLQQKERLQSELHRIEDQRASLATAWTLGHQVDRVRAVQNQYASFPKKSAFEDRDPDTNLVRIKWEKYIGYIALYYTRGFTAQYIDDFDTPDYDLATLTQTIERLVRASAPFQAWWISSRQLYRWEDPWRTARWFALFIYLWYTDHIIGFFYAYILYIVTKEGLFPSTIDSVRESLDRTLDQSAKARAWGDLVEKHGREDWVEPLLEHVGPQLLLQLEDLADFCEVLQNFYRWTAPHKTAATLFFFFCCLLVTLLSDMRYCMKIVWFIVGFAFFLCWPLSSHYPRYRSVLDPFRWTFWDIPTNAENALKHLQMKADDLESTAIEINDETSLRNTGIRKLFNGLKKKLPLKNERDHDDTYDQRSNYSTPPSQKVSPTRSSPSHRYHFEATENSASGELFIDRQGLRFSLRSSVVTWDISYQDLIEMRKGPRKVQKVKILGPALERLEILYRDIHGAELKRYIDLDLGERDKVFNLVVALSGLRWRSMKLEQAYWE